MQIKVASHSGFCFGVKRAINIAENALKGLKRKGAIYSLGPIIHNPQVVESLSRKGLHVISDIENLKSGTLIISSHGAHRELIQKIRRKHIKIIDATCPFVKYAHDIVRRMKKEGYSVKIIGDKEHPEVKALLSIAGKDSNGGKIGIVSQTTQDKASYLSSISDILKGDFNEVRIFNTICNDTADRQKLAHGLLKDCDIMIVIGGKNSANTRRLCQICKESGVDNYHVETEAEIEKSYFSGKKCAGVISGASTPDSMVRRVVRRIKEITRSR